jgi:hypothetical protein
VSGRPALLLSGLEKLAKTMFVELFGAKPSIREPLA